MWQGEKTIIQMYSILAKKVSTKTEIEEVYNYNIVHKYYVYIYNSINIRFLCTMF